MDILTKCDDIANETWNAVIGAEQTFTDMELYMNEGNPFCTGLIPIKL